MTDSIPLTYRTGISSNYSNSKNEELNVCKKRWIGRTKLPKWIKNHEFFVSSLKHYKSIDIIQHSLNKISLTSKISSISNKEYNTIINYLNKIEFFKLFDYFTLKKLIQHFRFKEYKFGDRIYTKNHSVKYIYILKYGQIKLYKSIKNHYNSTKNSTETINYNENTNNIDRFAEVMIGKDNIFGLEELDFKTSQDCLNWCINIKKQGISDTHFVKREWSCMAVNDPTQVIRLNINHLINVLYNNELIKSKLMNNYLKNNIFINGLIYSDNSDSIKNLLYLSCNIKESKKNDYIIKEGNPCELIIILNGLCNIEKRLNLIHTKTDKITSKQFFIDQITQNKNGLIGIELIKNIPVYTYSLKCISETVTYGIIKNVYNKTILKNIPFRLYCKERLKQLKQQLYNISQNYYFNTKNDICFECLGFPKRIEKTKLCIPTTNKVIKNKTYWNISPIKRIKKSNSLPCIKSGKQLFTQVYSHITKKKGHKTFDF